MPLPLVRHAASARSWGHVLLSTRLAWPTRTTALCCATGPSNSMGTLPTPVPMGLFLNGPRCGIVCVAQPATPARGYAMAVTTSRVPRSLRRLHLPPPVKCATTLQWLAPVVPRQQRAMPIPLVLVHWPAPLTTGPTSSFSLGATAASWLQAGQIWRPVYVHCAETIRLVPKMNVNHGCVLTPLISPSLVAECGQSSWSLW